MAVALKGSEYALCIHCLDPRPGRQLRALGDFLEYHRPSGIVLMPPLSGNDELAGLAWEFGCGCARLGAEQQPGDSGRFSTDDRQAAADAVHHLIGKGHRRIGFITGADGMRQAQLRELGYLDAMAEHDLDRGASLIASGDGGFEAGLAAANLLLEVSPRPTAILSASDEMAAAAIHAALAKGIAVPHALSVIGFGDTPLAPVIWPPLTTIRLPLLEMAHAAASWLIDPERSEPATPQFALEFIDRATVAPAQASTAEPSTFAFQSG
jgi:LacI family transcriptional regulator